MTEIGSMILFGSCTLFLLAICFGDPGAGQDGDE